MVKDATARALAGRAAPHYDPTDQAQFHPNSTKPSNEREDGAMSSQPAQARTPGAKRAGPGEYLFDLSRVNHIKGGPDYSSVEGGVVEGDRMIVALMRMPAGTGAVAHSHPNEQWIYIL